MKNKIFVSGATGFQGSNIAQLLNKAGKQVITLRPKTDENQISVKDIEIIEGNLENKEAVYKALKNVDSAVFTFPLIFDLEKAIEITENFIQSAQTNNVSLVVFNSSFDLPKSKTGLLALDLKSTIYKMFQDSGLNVITLIPDIYIDNLTAPWSIPLILEKGILPYPIESGKKLPIGGNIYSGEEIAVAISNYLGKEIQFISLTPDDFEKQLIPAFGELNAKEISNLYRYVADNREVLVDKNFNTSQNLLSTKPTSIQDWVSSVNWNM